MNGYRKKLLVGVTCAVISLSAVQADPIVPAIPGASIENVQPKWEPLAEELHMTNPQPQPKKSSVPAVETELTQSSTIPVSDEVLSLKKQLIDSEQRAKIAEVTAGATQKPTEANYAGALAVYDYKDGNIYDIYCGVGDITDISLQPGEVLNDKPASGDTVRWEMGIIKSGSAPNETTHVLLKPHSGSIQTTIIIPTNKHVYTLHAIARSNFHMVGARFNYPHEEFEAMTMKAENFKRLERTSEKTLVSPNQLDFNYRITGSEVEWKPKQVYNDGNKTFLVMPPEMKHGEAPVLFVLDENDNTMLVNYRLKEGIFIVDRLFNKAVLKIGEKQEVQISHLGNSVVAEANTNPYPRGHNEFAR